MASHAIQDRSRKGPQVPERILALAPGLRALPTRTAIAGTVLRPCGPRGQLALWDDRCCRGDELV